MEGACNRPTVKRPFFFTVTSGQRGEPPCKKRTTVARLCAPSASLQPAIQLGGPRPTCHATGATVTKCEKTALPLAPMPRLLGAFMGV
jgi:hypothetical protein